MLKITLEGPIASGKSTMANRIRNWCDEMGLTHMHKDNATEAAITECKPDVLIEEKVIR